MCAVKTGFFAEERDYKKKWDSLLQNSKHLGVDPIKMLLLGITCPGRAGRDREARRGQGRKDQARQGRE